MIAGNFDIPSYQSFQMTSLLRHTDPPWRDLYLILGGEKETKSTFLSSWKNMGRQQAARSEKKVEKQNEVTVKQPMPSGTGQRSTQEMDGTRVILSGKEVAGEIIIRSKYRKFKGMKGWNMKKLWLYCRTGVSPALRHCLGWHI